MLAIALLAQEKLATQLNVYVKCLCSPGARRASMKLLGSHSCEDRCAEGHTGGVRSTLHARMRRAMAPCAFFLSLFKPR